MKLDKLIDRLQEIRTKYGGDCEVDVLTETDTTGQVEQPLGELAVSTTVIGTPRPSRVKLLPEGFT